MYLKVLCLNGFAKELTYSFAAGSENHDYRGQLVKVPLQRRFELALIIDQFQELSDKPKYVIKEIAELCSFTILEPFKRYEAVLRDYYNLESVEIYQRIHAILFPVTKTNRDVIVQKQQTISITAVQLTAEQQKIVDVTISLIGGQQFHAGLIHGVTGSGKTEVYKKLIEQAIIQKQSVIFTVPEVSLAVQFMAIFSAWASFPVVVFHSAMNVADKEQLIACVHTATPCLIIGVHLPLLLPLHNLGLIIVDEEHEVGYQEKKHPKMQVREMALLRAQREKTPLFLGSATPSIASLHAVAHNKMALYELPNRYAGSFPTMQQVYMFEDKQRPHFWISSLLAQKIKQQLINKEQTILFLNRRGYSFFLKCGACGGVLFCPSCSVSLTIHDNNQLQCHYCGYHQSLPQACPNCCAHEKYFIKKGIGTQQLVPIIEKMFPAARVTRVDLDTTRNKKRTETILQDFTEHRFDILIGTQTITKGYHFPGVTLVGIIWADMMLSYPVYNATEVALQQLIQVAGRAGRQSSDSCVVVQSFSQHPIFEFMHERDYKKFYEYERRYRELLSYPPYKRFACIELQCHDENIVTEEINRVMTVLEPLAQQYQIDLLGPALPAVHKINNTHVRMVYLKVDDAHVISFVYRKIKKELVLKSSLFLVRNPMS
jgi:primosomal protein N' (replication factor Y)